MCLMEYFSAIKRIQSHHLHQHGETGNLYVKWDEAGTDNTVQLIHTWNLKKLISQNLSAQRWFQREDSGEGEMQTCWLMGTKLQHAASDSSLQPGLISSCSDSYNSLVPTLHTCVSPLFPPWHFPKVTFQIGR